MLLKIDSVLYIRFSSHLIIP